MAEAVAAVSLGTDVLVHLRAAVEGVEAVEDAEEGDEEGTGMFIALIWVKSPGVDSIVYIHAIAL